MTQTLSVCPYCAVGCGVLLEVEEGRIVSASPASAERHGGGQLCAKGRFGFSYVHHPERLQAPLIRREWAQRDGRWHWDGEVSRGRLAPPLAAEGQDGARTPAVWRERFREATWSEALDLVATQLQRVVHAGGPGAVAGLASAKCSNEENHAFVRLLRGAIGTNNVDHCARLCHASSVAAMSAQLGTAAATGGYEDLDHADVILVLGANVTESHPVLGTRLLKAVKRGASLIVADVRRTELADRAAVFLQVRPGTDHLLLLGMLRHVAQAGLIDWDFVTRRTRGIGLALESARAFTLDEIAGRTGVPAARIAEAAELYARGPATTTLWAMGLAQHAHGTQVVSSVLNLGLACGMVGRRGAALIPLRGQNNVQGACDVGALPNVLAGYQPVTSAAARARWERAWGVPEHTIPATPGLRSTEFHAEGSPVRALYLLGENPVLSDPDLAGTERWLKRLDFLVVHDLFLTETARLADVVLPGAAAAEKQGTYVSLERRIQLSDAAVDPPGHVRRDLDVLAELSERLGLPPTTHDAASTMDELRRVLPEWEGAGYAELREGGGLQYPVTATAPLGTPILHAESFPTPDGRARLVPVAADAPPVAASADYPFVLVTGRTRFHWQTGTMTRRVEALESKASAPSLDLAPADAERLGCRTGDRVRVSSPNGELEVAVSVSERQPPGVAFLPMHYREAAANRLTGGRVDPVSGTPELKQVAVRIERIRLS